MKEFTASQAKGERGLERMRRTPSTPTMIWDSHNQMPSRTRSRQERKRRRGSRERSRRRRSSIRRQERLRRLSSRRKSRKLLRPSRTEIST